jgi:hypothetical protein
VKHGGAKDVARRVKPDLATKVRCKGFVETEDMLLAPAATRSRMRLAVSRVAMISR